MGIDFAPLYMMAAAAALGPFRKQHYEHSPSVLPQSYHIPLFPLFSLFFPLPALWLSSSPEGLLKLPVVFFNFRCKTLTA